MNIDTYIPIIVLIFGILILATIIFLSIILIHNCIKCLRLKNFCSQTRFEPRSLDDINTVERRLNIGIVGLNYELSQTSFEPRSLEEINTIEGGFDIGVDNALDEISLTSSESSDLSEEIYGLDAAPNMHIMDTRFAPRSLDEISNIERRLNTSIVDQNYEFSQTRFEPSAPLEEIYTIDIAPNMYTINTKPPPYR